jgi:myo-inositol 2-dehydrogenase / D-chiro-inositol 1-dehydrogenase
MSERPVPDSAQQSTRQPAGRRSLRRGASRREFIKSSSVLVGGALAGVSLAGGVHAAGSDELKIGLIGCGGRGRGAVADTLAVNQGLKVVALGDAFEDAVNGAYESMKRQFGERIDVPKERRFHGLDAYQKVIDSGVDMVLLCEPPGFRPISFEAAVKAGKHVFMEKPVAIDAPGVRRVLAASQDAKAKGLGVGVGLQRHHQRSYLETVGRIKDGAIGDVLYTRVYWNGAGVWVRPRQPNQSEMEYQVRNWYYFTWLSGDHICEQHIHNIDVSNWIFDGPPVSAQGMGGREVRRGKDHGEIFDHHYVEFTYANGAKMFSHCRHIPGCWDSVSEHAHGTKGTADVSGSRINGERVRVEGGGNPYQVEHAVLVASIRAGNPINEADNGANSSMTAVLGRLATYSGKMIQWNEAINSSIALVPDQYTWDGKPPVLPDKNGNYPVPVPGQTKVV